MQTEKDFVPYLIYQKKAAINPRIILKTFIKHLCIITALFICIITITSTKIFKTDNAVSLPSHILCFWKLKYRKLINSLGHCCRHLLVYRDHPSHELLDQRDQWRQAACFGQLWGEAPSVASRLEVVKTPLASSGIWDQSL